MIIKCKRCGRCCVYMKDGKPTRCHWLIGEVGKITSCRVYSSRFLGMKIDEGIECTSRIYIEKNFDNCPYNRQ